MSVGYRGARERVASTDGVEWGALLRPGPFPDELQQRAGLPGPHWLSLTTD